MKITITLKTFLHILSPFLLFVFPSAQAQNIILNKSNIGSVSFEYSALAVWNNKMLLIPQDCRRTLNSLKMVSLKYLLKNSEINLSPSSDSFITIPIYYSYKPPSTYQGWEAVTVIKNSNTIFLMAESNDSDDYCYLLKGTINNKGVNLYSYKLIKKFRRECDTSPVKNAGFESLAYIGNGKLLTIFEYAANKRVGYLIDTSFKGELLQKIYFKNSLCYRITDMCMDNTGNLYGLHLCWGGEYENYVKNCKCKTGISRFDNLFKKEDSLYFAEIIQIYRINDSTYDFKPIKTIINSGKPNWEGLAFANNYFFIISDANNDLRYWNQTNFMAIHK